MWMRQETFSLLLWRSNAALARNSLLCEMLTFEREREQKVGGHYLCLVLSADGTRVSLRWDVLARTCRTHKDAENWLTECCREKWVSFLREGRWHDISLLTLSSRGKTLVDLSLSLRENFLYWRLLLLLLQTMTVPPFRFQRDSLSVANTSC